MTFPICNAFPKAQCYINKKYRQQIHFIEPIIILTFIGVKVFVSLILEEETGAMDVNETCIVIMPPSSFCAVLFENNEYFFEPISSSTHSE